MNSSSPSIAEPREFLRLAARHWLRWLLPAVALTLLAAVYAATVSPTWQASQTLILRNEASGGETGPGKFRGAEEMKSVQETILELAKSRGVLASALKKIGPPASCTNPAAWPAARDVDALQQIVKISPPKGVEFGTAEVFYLEVRDTDADRAVQLNAAICDQLQIRFQELRDAKAQSMTDELNKTVHLAQTDLQTATAQLADLEKQVGSDLGELRSLQDSNSTDTSLRRSVGEIENELRQVRTLQKANRQLLDLLRAAQSDPGRLLAAPSRLLESQPGLKRLKEGLVDAQLQTARLQGNMSAVHPAVLAARDAEEHIGRRLHDEITVAIHGLEAEGRLDADRLGLLEGQLARSSQRLSNLAAIRANYVNLVAEAAHRTKLVERAEQNLAEARAAGAGAKAASLIARIDSPETGAHPVSPSRAIVLLIGVLGGLATGFGVLLLTVPAGRGEAPAEKSSPWADTEAVVEQDFSAALPCVQPWDTVAPASPSGMTFKQALKRINERANVPSATRS